MKDKFLEVQVENEDHMFDITIFLKETIYDIKKTIMNLYEYKNMNKFCTYLGDFHLNEFYDNLTIEELMTSFVIEKFKIRDKKTLQLYEQNNLNVKELTKSLLNLNEKVLRLYENNKLMKHRIKEVERTEINLTNYLVGLNKYSVINNEKNNLENDSFHDIYISKEKEYEEKMEKLLKLKLMEKKGIKLGFILNDLSLELNELNNTYLELVKKLEAFKNEEENLKKTLKSNEMKKDLYVNIKKVIHIEDIEHRFETHYKHDMIIKLLNENSLIIYHVNTDKLEIRQFKDNCNFSEFYLSQMKQDEFYLNFQKKLLICINKLVFEYNYSNNTMTEICKLHKDHRGANFIYVPSNNSIYCVSGLLTPSTEFLALDKNFNYSYLIGWIEINVLNQARGYYSIYVQNESIIYVVFGFNLFSGEYLSSLEKYDTSIRDPKWIFINLTSNKSFYLIFAGVLPITDQEIYLVGGKDHHNNDNYSIISLNLRRFMIEDTQMKLPSASNDNLMQNETKNLFYQESCFLPLNSSNQGYILANFDTKNFVHFINLKTFEYAYINRYELGRENLVIINEINSRSSSENENN